MGCARIPDLPTRHRGSSALSMLPLRQAAQTLKTSTQDSTYDWREDGAHLIRHRGDLRPPCPARRCQEPLGAPPGTVLSMLLIIPDLWRMQRRDALERRRQCKCRLYARVQLIPGQQPRIARIAATEQQVSHLDKLGRRRL